MQHIMIGLMLDLLSSVFLYRIHHLPLSIPYACSETNLAPLNFVLKFFSFASLVESRNALINHEREGNAASPTVVKGICPYPGYSKT